MEAKPNLLEVTLEDGKYTVIQDGDGKLFALRYNQPWRELVGDKLILSLANEVSSLREHIDAIESERNKYLTALERLGVDITKL